MARSRPRITLVVLGINTNEDIRPWITLARGLIYSKSRVICNIVTHEQFAPMLADGGVGFLNGGACPFHARENTVEGRSFDKEAQAWDKSGVVTVVPEEYAGSGLESFMSMIVRGWFEAGLEMFQDAPCDLAILCGSTSALVYSSVCEALGVCFAIGYDAPMVENTLFSPPLGFVNDDAFNQNISPEDRARQWKVHAESVWGCLFEGVVNDCRKSIIRHPYDKPHACNRTFSSRKETKHRIALMKQGENQCLTCAKGDKTSDCRAGSALPVIKNPRGCIEEPSVVSASGKGKKIPILLFYSPHLLERPSEWDHHVIVAGPLFDADEALHFLPNPTSLLNKTHASVLNMTGSEDMDTISSLSSDSSEQKPKPSTPLKLSMLGGEDDDLHTWKFPPRSNSELSSLLPDEIHRFLFQRSIGSSSSSSTLGSLGAATLRPTVYIDLGKRFATWSSASSRSLVLQQLINTARAVNCRVILVADSSIVLPFNLLSQHPSVEWTEDRQAVATSKHHSHIGDLGSLVRMTCDDILVLRRPVGDCTDSGGGNRAASMAVALLSRCSGVLGPPTSWLMHAAALAGTPLAPLDFSRSDSPDSFWGSQLQSIHVSPVEPLVVQDCDHQNPGLSEDSLRLALEAFVDPYSHTRCTARELSAMTRAHTANSLHCTFAEYKKHGSSSKKGKGADGSHHIRDLGILKTPRAGTTRAVKRDSKSPSRVGGEPNGEFKCLESSVRAVLGLAMPLVRKHSSSNSLTPSRRSVSPMKKKSPRRTDNNRYFEEEDNKGGGGEGGGGMRGRSPRRSHQSREAKL